MKQRPTAFFSDGRQIDADLYLPSDLASGDTRPALVTCSGYQGLKVWGSNNTSGRQTYAAIRAEQASEANHSRRLS